MVFSGLKTLNTRRDLMVLMSFPLLLPLQDTHTHRHRECYGVTSTVTLIYTVLVARMPAVYLSTVQLQNDALHLHTVLSENVV